MPEPHLLIKEASSALRICSVSRSPGSASREVRYEDRSRAASSIKKKPSAIRAAISSSFPSLHFAASKNPRALPNEVSEPSSSSVIALAAPSDATRKSSTLDSREI